MRSSTARATTSDGTFDTEGGEGGEGIGRQPAKCLEYWKSVDCFFFLVQNSICFVGESLVKSSEVWEVEVVV